MLPMSPAPIHRISSDILLEKATFFLCLFGAIAVLAWTVQRLFQARSALMKAHLEVRNQILARTGSLEELLAFARTEEGRGFLEPPTLPATVPHGLRMIQAGILVLFLALGLLLGKGLAARGQSLMVALAGIGLLAAGLAGRRLRTRWALRDLEP